MSKPFDSTIKVSCPCGALFYAEGIEIDYSLIASEFIDAHKNHDSSLSSPISSGFLPPDVPGDEMMATSRKLFPRRYPPPPRRPDPSDPT